MTLETLYANSGIKASVETVHGNVEEPLVMRAVWWTGGIQHTYEVPYDGNSMSDAEFVQHAVLRYITDVLQDAINQYAEEEANGDE